MIKILKKNKLFIFFYLLLLILVFSPHFFLSFEDKNIKFGKKGTNFFFKKYKNDNELFIYLDQKYDEYKNLTNKELCSRLVHETFELKKPIRKILSERNITDCRNELMQ